jgi:hypothetical protein
VSRRLDERFAAAVASRHRAAELVDRFVRIEPDDGRVVAHVGPRRDAGRPARKIVVFHGFPELGTDVGAGTEFIKRNPTAETDPSQVGAKGLEGCHGRHKGKPCSVPRCPQLSENTGRMRQEQKRAVTILDVR